MNLTQVRNNLNRFNDSFKHQNYIPKVLPIFDHQTHQIVTWTIFSAILFCLTLIFMRLSYKINRKEILNESQSENIQDEIAV